MQTLNKWLIALLLLAGNNAFAQYVLSGDTRGTLSVAAGVGSLTERANGVAVGENASTAFSGVAVGTGAKGSNDTGVAIGVGAVTVADFTGRLGAIGIGANAQSQGTSIVMGANAKAVDTDAVSVGKDAVSNYQAISIGHHSTAYASGSLAIGTGSSAAPSATNSVAIGMNTLTERANTIAVGNRSVSQLQDGIEESDAVTVRQLRAAIAALMQSSNYVSPLRSNDPKNK
jgi:trimeric autotransporter adhesin